MSQLLSKLYRVSFGLLTDFYEITMAFGYWKGGIAERRAAFHVVFRHNPFGGGFTVACGLATVVEFLQNFGFDADDIQWLATLRGRDGNPIFEPAFLDYLRHLRFTADVDAVPEGTVVFPHEPILRVIGPLAQCQLVESAVLNILNFQTLIATKAARVVLAARGKPVLEFGLRRAQGIDGAISATRAAYIGGCVGTSNTLAGKLLGIPVRGTHAHSWVMCFDSELEAFRAFAQTVPGNCILLVDTYQTLQGVRHAVEIARELGAAGHRLIGIRLDSGDLAYLSQEARRILDEAGLHDVLIAASGDLDEHIIASLHEQGAKIDLWGVGTRLVTAYDEPALGGVYKLTALQDAEGRWVDKVKVSEQAVKSSTPGILQVRRYIQNGEAIGDAIFDELRPPAAECVIVDPADPTRRKRLPADAQREDLLIPILRGGELVRPLPSLEEARMRLQGQLALFHPGIKRFVNPHSYPAGLELSLHQRKFRAILRQKGHAPEQNSEHSPVVSSG
ncbi:MAG: nicotinate phosphoribosyltransferase [Thermoguttaceae bacterium]|nr:nicotinate phosphoribosyltransferase [Thermoguttaceae bacterium]MDW8078041.1 nicotinate phosphoribosyltransferase [Thermoguttaceae bacterium]